uniref:Uncharacterized protein n=1 Tax=Trichuris muris TaxID=70415 RepID=A0A5S6QSV7_TRIMR
MRNGHLPSAAQCASGIFSVDFSASKLSFSNLNSCGGSAVVPFLLFSTLPAASRSPMFRAGCASHALLSRLPNPYGRTVTISVKCVAAKFMIVC